MPDSGSEAWAQGVIWYSPRNAPNKREMYSRAQLSATIERMAKEKNSQLPSFADREQEVIAGTLAWRSSCHACTVREELQPHLTSLIYERPSLQLVSSADMWQASPVSVGKCVRVRAHFAHQC